MQQSSNQGVQHIHAYFISAWFRFVSSIRSFAGRPEEHSSEQPRNKIVLDLLNWFAPGTSGTAQTLENQATINANSGRWVGYLPFCYVGAPPFCVVIFQVLINVSISFAHPLLIPC